MFDRQLSMEERLKKHPILKNRIESLPDIVENTSNDVEKADDAEYRVTDEIRQMGNETPHDRASGRETALSPEFRANNEKAVSHEKKVCWHTTFGTIIIFEQVFSEDGHSVRPFCQSGEVTCRSYSNPSQRRVTDFGSDVPFNKISKKLEEHYGITISYSAARQITQKHAKAIKDEEELPNRIPDQTGADYIIAQTDGTMIPVLDKDDGDSKNEDCDGRKSRKGKWKEVRMTLTHPEGSVNPYFGCASCGADDAGDHLLNCAVHSGMGVNTQARCVGDGAAWIFLQTQRVFGEQGRYLIDFYHLCEYLSCASKACSPDNVQDFFVRLKTLMKDNRTADALEALKPYIEPDCMPDEKAPVRRCYRYIENRPGQFNYKEALEKRLPNRLKIAGAWWKENNAQNMIALRILRANGKWESYWEKNQAA